MASKDCQEGGLVFGRWKLFPVDASNWELCHLHETKGTPQAIAAGTAGQVRWNRLGRYYQWNTIPSALLYAADCELRDNAHEQSLSIIEALDEYRAITDTMRAELTSALGGQA